jgi:adenine-specific DNA-methyltransferase
LAYCIAQELTFCFDDSNLFMVNTCYFLNTGNKYLMGVLNSKLINYYYKDISVQLGKKGLRHFTIYIEQIPVKIPSPEQEIKINKIVEKIILLKDENQLQDTTDLEKQIDKLVYQLYDLTEEEIKIVEKN